MATKKGASKKSSTTGPRPSWQGHLTFGLVSFKVEAVNALDRKNSDIHFHQLHATCGRRIHYAKMCPVHGEIDADEIAMGYEKSPGNYVEIDPEELKEVKTEQAKTITIDVFVEPDAVDPIYYDGRMYYLLPAEEVAQTPYGVFVAAMERKGTLGIGEIILSGKQQLAMIRAQNGIMHMAMLNYDAEIKPVDDFTDKLSKLSGQTKQIRLAQTLIEELEEKDFDYSKYIDETRKKVEKVIEKNSRSGKSVKEEEEEPQERNVISLMDALQKSLKSKNSSTAVKPTKARSKRASPTKKSRASRAS